MKGKVLLIFLILIIILPIYGVEQIPEWVKYNAKLWSENQIDDQSFLNALEFLIENQIIKLFSYRNDMDILLILDSNLIRKFSSRIFYDFFVNLCLATYLLCYKEPQVTK